ncbi:GGDEF domain-containing protein [uncultured Treponema sp.]|uniref:GGDEF domain-containing protein n=1 Tax=uncultured Treponema sp. TaxID=162155 RepID=UPI0025D36D01|nr:GGDEF domain-containing protein [uncultured Treponema sp.]
MKNRGLSFKFTLMFVGFTLATLILTSLLSFYSQMHIYKSQKEESLQKVAVYLEKLLVTDGEEFLLFNQYFIEHASEFKIPIDFNWDTVEQDRVRYETLFQQQNPGKVLGQTVSFDELSDELKHIFTQYNFEYYRMLFDEVQDTFGIIYAYYLIPTGEKGHMYWVLDAIREPVEKDGETYMNLCIDVPNSEEGYPLMWEAWYSGKSPRGYHIYNNEYGKTYAYYAPLSVKEKTIGVIGVEVEIENVNHEILIDTLKQMLVTGSILILSMSLLLVIIRVLYIKKLVKLRNFVEEYSYEKKPEITKKLKAEIKNKDEISTLMAKFSDMIYELELYMQNLRKTKKDLQKTRKQAIELNELAYKDALTGIRNKTGYDREVMLIEWEMAEGLQEFGIALIDLNFLKKINETFGDDKGNAAIVLLSEIICRVFEHSPVFRLKDGEFAVVLKDSDLKNITELIIEFQRRLGDFQKNHHLEVWQRVSAAIGFAIYDPNIDAAFENLFKRAEEALHANKKEMKARFQNLTKSAD